jgi:dipeptidyl aminopeptidase/acylaminoacyl peptidase
VKAHRLFVTAFCAIAALAAPQARQTGGGLTIEKLLEFRHPSEPAWAPDGRTMAFLWEQSGKTGLYAVAADGNVPRQLAAFDDTDVGGPTWSADGSTIYFARGGKLLKIPPAGGTPAPVWDGTSGEGGFAFSPDMTRVAFNKQGDLWVRPLGAGDARRITSTPEMESRAIWSPDGQQLAYTTGETTRHADPAPYVGAKLLFAWFERKNGDLFVVPAAGGTPRAISPGPMREGAPRWIDKDRLVFDRFSEDTTTREIVIANAQTGEAKVVHRDVDQKWWSPPFSARPSPQPSPEGAWIAFIADTDGWDHIYILKTDGSGAKPVQVTRGRFEAWRPSWSPDGSRIVFDANSEASPGVRQLGIASIASNGEATVRFATTGRGTNTSGTWSPNGDAVVYQHTDPHNSADLFVARVDGSTGGTPVRLTDSMPSGIDRAAFVEPTLVKYKAADGLEVPAYLFVPKNLDKSRKHPAIVWVHGDGINQNYDGWHIERNYAVYYSFHQYLLQQGYVVIAPDYRGSIGYGRDWRHGAFMEVGGKDYRDVEAVAGYLKTLPYVDANRIGIWGLSYGGFFTLLALTDAPTTFAAAVDVAGVVDYRMYFEDPYKGGWTYSRIRSPEESPKAYDVASPLSRADRITRPLLILHGTADVNVPYIESLRLTDTLLKLGKPFDFMTYPGEFHYFQRAHVLRDAWTRVDRFFAKWLKGEKSAVGRTF